MPERRTDPEAGMSHESTAVSGIAADVPYIALPPAGRGDGDEAAPLIVAWHLNDPPRSAAAMASALPLAGVPAWRVYLTCRCTAGGSCPAGWTSSCSWATRTRF
jgi:hypothetical protein